MNDIAWVCADKPWHVLLQINGKGVFCHLEVVDAPVGLDEILVPAKVVAP